MTETWSSYPYGEEWTQSGPGTEENRFTGHLKDDETELYYAGARFLDQNSRWLSVDSVLGDSSNPQHLNRFSYTLSDPVNFLDPDGRFPFGYEEGEYIPPFAPFQGGRPEQEEEAPDEETWGASFAQLLDRLTELAKQLAETQENDCESMAQLFDAAAGWFDTSEDMVGALRLVLTETDAYGRIRDDLSNYVGDFGQNGFAAEFLEDSAGNQVRHFVGALGLGFLIGSKAANNILFAREVVQGWVTFPGSPFGAPLRINWADVRLNGPATDLGGLLRGETGLGIESFDRHAAGDFIRAFVCDKESLQ